MFTRREDRIDLPSLILSEGEKGQRSYLHNRVNNEDRQHHDENRAECQTKMAFIPADILHSVSSKKACPLTTASSTFYLKLFLSVHNKLVLMTFVVLDRVPSVGSIREVYTSCL